MDFQEKFIIGQMKKEQSISQTTYPKSWTIYWSGREIKSPGEKLEEVEKIEKQEERSDEWTPLEIPAGH